jgi:hypothetical protein
MQRASDCEMVLAHDDDLMMIDGLGHDTVSGLLSTCILTLFLHVGSHWKPSNQT